MSTIINIDGGLGRAITAIPALLKYNQLHPDEEWFVMIHGWDFMTWGISELQNRTFNPETKGIFDRFFWNATKIITPEPYKIPAYYRQEISLREAFDEEINNTTDHSDLPELSLTLSDLEIVKGHEIIHQAKQHQKKEKTIVIQPYGRSANRCPMGVFDPTYRSLSDKSFEQMVSILSKNYNLIFMGEKDFYDGKTFIPMPDPNLREWAGVIQAADYFIGCDSCGQHIARAVRQEASVFVTGTHKVNITYPDVFHIIERDVPFYPSPMRFCGMDSQLATRLNEPRAKFTEEEIEKACQEIIERVDKNQSKTLETFVAPKECRGLCYT